MNKRQREALRAAIKVEVRRHLAAQRSQNGRSDTRAAELFGFGKDRTHKQLDEAFDFFNQAQDAVKRGDGQSALRRIAAGVKSLVMIDREIWGKLGINRVNPLIAAAKRSAARAEEEDYRARAIADLNAVITLVQGLGLKRATAAVQEAGNIAGLAKHLSSKYGGDPRFFRKCMASDELADYPEENRQAICARAHKIAVGKWPAED